MNSAVCFSILTALVLYFTSSYTGCLSFHLVMHGGILRLLGTHVQGIESAHKTHVCYSKAKVTPRGQRTKIRLLNLFQTVAQSCMKEFYITRKSIQGMQMVCSAQDPSPKLKDQAHTQKPQIKNETNKHCNLVMNSGILK